MHAVGIHLPELFQALADPTRLRIVRLLAATGEESCLCELVDSLLEPQYELSRHLKQSGVLTAERERRRVYHRLVSGRPYLGRLYAAIRLLPDVERESAADVARFGRRKRMRPRERGRCRVGIQTPKLAARAP